MTGFSWRHQGESPIKVRTLVRQHGVSRNLLKQIKFNGGRLLVNRRPVHVTHVMQPNDVLTVVLPPEPGNERVLPSFEPLDILYDDDHFLVVNKPALVASVPSHLYPDDSLVNRVKGYLMKTHAENQVTHIVTRLDRETSGAVIFAKHHFAHTVLDEQLKAQTIKKTYLALVQGTLNEHHGLVNQPIGRLPDSFIARQVRVNGKKALTEYWVIKQMKHTSLVRLRLHTGRTHQIRVHMSWLHHPLVGDFLYGHQMNPWINRQALHCAAVSFHHPFKDEQVTCYAPLPADFKTAIEFEAKL